MWPTSSNLTIYKVGIHVVSFKVHVHVDGIAPYAMAAVTAPIAEPMAPDFD
jgi:hypothetical protein